MKRNLPGVAGAIVRDRHRQVRLRHRRTGALLEVYVPRGIERVGRRHSIQLRIQA